MTSIIRFVEFRTYDWKQGFSDETWFSGRVIPWTIIEAGVYHLTACFMTFRPLFRWIIFESPLSFILSRNYFLSRNKSAINDTVDQRRAVSHTIFSIMDNVSDRNTLISHNSRVSESAAAGDYEFYRMDHLGIEREYQVEHVSQVSKIP